MLPIFAAALIDLLLLSVRTRDHGVPHSSLAVCGSTLEAQTLLFQTDSLGSYGRHAPCTLLRHPSALSSIAARRQSRIAAAAVRPIGMNSGETLCGIDIIPSTSRFSHAGSRSSGTRHFFCACSCIHLNKFGVLETGPLNSELHIATHCRMSCATRSCWCLPTSRICPMP